MNSICCAAAASAFTALREVEPAPSFSMGSTMVQYQTGRYALYWEAMLRLKFQVQHPEPEGRRMLRWTDEASTSAARNVA